MFIPTKEYFYDMKPEEFEKYSLELLKEQTKGLENLEIQHNIVMRRSDGSYQIDGKIQFDVMGVRYVTLIECKHYKSPITRDKVQILYDKIRAIGAHKGILISTSNFQSGAIKYAKEHGIGLIQIVEADLIYEIRTKPNVIMMDANINLYNNGQEYIGIMQIGNEVGFRCISLLEGDNTLKEFLISDIEKLQK